MLRRERTLRYSGIHVNTGLDRPEQTELNGVISACMVDFDVTDYYSDTDSVAELEFNTWDDACAWEFRNAPGNLPPGLFQYFPAEGILNTSG